MSMAFHATLSLAAKAGKAMGGGASSTPPLKFLAARKKLARFGVQALLPSVHPKYRDGEQDVSKLSVKERVWHPPLIPKRKVNVLRNIAKVEGTYGTFDPETLKGWEAQWDLDLAVSRPRGTGRYMTLRKPRLTARARSREDRAQKIEAALEGMDERMEALQEARVLANKKDYTIMAKFNALLGKKSKRKKRK